MKTRITITLDEENLKLIENKLKENPTEFRNKSHFVESSVVRFLSSAKEGRE